MVGVIEMSEEQFIKDFQDNYHRIFNYTGGQSVQLMFSLASKYTLAKMQFSGVILQKIIEEIQDSGEKPLNIRLESNTSYKLAFHLLQAADRSKAIKQIGANDLILESVKFKKSPIRIVSALFLDSNNMEHAKRAKLLFDEMNRKQRFLTSKEDLPYVVFLTKDPNVQPKTQADTIMKYYSSLRNNRFAMGNHLQALAQIMTVYSEDYNKIMLEYVVKIREVLIQRGIKVKKLHHPYLGVLALAASDDSKIDELSSLYKQLVELKIFKNAKEYALVVAIQKVVHDLVEVENLVDLSTLTSILDLLDIVDFVLELGQFVPSGISEVIDFFN